MAPRKRIKLGESTKDNESRVIVNNEAASASVAVPKKPRQGAKNRKSRKKGKLARMLELPLEVFTEIASYMSPYDIIQLARSTKALREKLMSKTSKQIWLAARSSMGVPDLDKFSEPHYADLLFSKRCHGENCYDNHAMKVSYALGVRLCKGCFEHATIQGTDLRCKKEYRDLLPSFPGAKDYRLLESSISTIITRFEQCKSLEEKEKAIVDVKADTACLNDSAKRVESWCTEQAKLKQEANAALCSARRKSIEEKLLSMGYSVDDLDCPLRQRRLEVGHAARPAPSTYRDNLEEDISAIRRDVDYFVYNLRSLKHMDGKADQFASINLATLYRYFPAFQAMLDDPDCVRPVPDETWETLDGGFVDALTVLSKKVESEGRATMEDAYQIAGEPNISDKGILTDDMVPLILLRATYFFKHEHNLMSYAGILKLRADTPFGKRQEEWYKEVPKGVIGMAKALLRHLSLPENASMLSLEKLGKVFVCQRCLRYDTIGEDLAWSGLVQHFYENHKEHEDRMSKREELGVDVPLRNEHDLTQIERKKKIFVSISPYNKNRVKLTVSVICDGDSYPKLSEYTLDQWGYDSYGAYSSIYHEWDVEGDDTDEETLTWTKGENDDWSCKLCAKLGDTESTKWDSDALTLGMHMKRIHGTDFDGLPLVSKSKSKSSV